MRELLEAALGAAQRGGATYTEIRALEREHERIQLKNGHMDRADTEISAGVGVRVLVAGAWGFAATAYLDAAHLESAVRLAIDIARASAAVNGAGLRLPSRHAVVADLATPFDIDPFAVSLDQKVQLLTEADDIIHATPGVKVSQAFMDFRREHKRLATSEGSYIEQRRIESGAGISATAVGDGDMQVRTYPGLPTRCQTLAAGYEHIIALKLVEHAADIAREAVDLLTADPCPAGEYDLIIHPSQLVHTIHETCGHAVELDRVLGLEAGYAGTSFLTLDKRGHFRYGSPIVNLTADATTPRSIGSFAYDDEGQAGNRTFLVRDGIFEAYITSRETAQQAGVPSVPSVRAESWEHLPISRMTTISLEPGDSDIDDIIADTKRGIWIANNKSGSIDDHRLNFQFGAEIAYLIENGRLTRLLKNPTYTGITPDFWGSCDAIGDAASWQLYGLTMCGKGEPQQIGRIGHGASPARFRNVRVGVMKLCPSWYTSPMPARPSVSLPTAYMAIPTMCRLHKGQSPCPLRSTVCQCFRTMWLRINGCAR